MWLSTFMICVHTKFCLFSSLVVVMKVISKENSSWLPYSTFYRKELTLTTLHQEIVTICHIMAPGGTGIASTSQVLLGGGLHCHNSVKENLFQILKQSWTEW